MVSDATAILELVAHRSAADLKEACEHAINAGVDMDMNSRGYVNFLPELVKEGKVSESRLDEAVRNVAFDKNAARPFRRSL